MSESANMSASNGKNNSANGVHKGDEEAEPSLIDVILIVVRNRQLITRTTIVVGCIGLLFALFAAPDFTSSARVIREVETEDAMRNLGGLSLLRGMGINLGSTSMGLTPEAYPDILNSREVRLAVVRDTFFFEDLGRLATFTEFANQTSFIGTMKRYTLGLPRTIRRAMQNDTRENVALGRNSTPLPTEEEEKAMKAVLDLTSTSIDPESGLMIISTTTSNAMLSADLTNSFVRHLVERIETIRTEKARRDLAFIQNRYEQAQDSLGAAEAVLALFDDRNTNPQSARLRTERSQYQRQVNFKAELFSDLRAQLTQAEIDLQRSRPVITVLEHPVPPIESSGPPRVLLVVVSLLLGAILGIGLAFTRSVLESIRSKDEGKAKIEEIKKVLSPIGNIKQVTRKFTRKTAQES